MCSDTAPEVVTVLCIALLPHLATCVRLLHSVLPAVLVAEGHCFLLCEEEHCGSADVLKGVRGGGPSGESILPPDDIRVVRVLGLVWGVKSFEFEEFEMQALEAKARRPTFLSPSQIQRCRSLG